jgi:hypothetical protein
MLAGRYRIESVAPGPGTESAFVAVHLQTGEPVLLVELAPPEASALRAAILASHPALATLLELVELADGRSVGVFDWVEGSTLAERLARGRALTPKVALRLVILMTDVLSVLHRRGATHGLLRPDAIVVGNRERRQPVLSYAPRAQGTPYESPERRRVGPRPSDDVWALAAILHELVVRRPPPPAGYAALPEVEAVGVQPPELASAIGGCLLQDVERRVKTVQLAREGFVRALDVIAGPQPAAVEVPEGTQGGTPIFGEISPGPRLPRAVAGRVLVALSIGVAVVAVLTVFLVVRRPAGDAPVGKAADSALGSSSAAARAARRPPRPAPSRAPRDQPGAKPEADAIRVDELPSDREIARCVERQFPAGSFEVIPDYSWLCLTTDPRSGAARMRVALVVAAGKRQLTPAMDIWSRMGWYGMAGFAVVRQACCPRAAPVQLERTGDCDPLDALINDLASAAQRGSAIEEYLERYADNVRCQLSHGHGAQFQVGVRFGGGQDAALRRLIESRRH